MEPAELYGLPLEQFTPERNALAKELRRDGRRDAAERVAKLRKPSVAAWAVNQLVRTQRREMDALLKAGEELQKAQADLVAGRGDSHELRAAVDAERAAVDQLTQRARGLLSSDGHELPPARLEQVSETLHAAALDPDARAQVDAGCLVRELRHIGLGALAAGGTGASRAKARARGSGKGKDAGKAELRKAQAAARRRLERAAHELEAAEKRRRNAEAELREADEALTRAREAMAGAERDHREAENALG